MSLMLALTGGGTTITGDLAATDSADTASFTGRIEHTGVLAAIEASDTAVFTGAIIAHPEPAGMTFTPVRVGHAQVTTKLLRVVYGKITATGESGSFAAVAEALPSARVRMKYGSVGAVGAAAARARSRSVAVVKHRITAVGAATAKASGSLVRPQYGAVSGVAGAWVKVHGAHYKIAYGVVTAGGVQNLADEEIILIYRHLQLKRKSGRKRHGKNQSTGV